MALPTRSNTLTGLPTRPSPRTTPVSTPSSTPTLRSRSLPRVTEADLIPRPHSTTGIRRSNSRIGMNSTEKEKEKGKEEVPPVPTIPLRHRNSLSNLHLENRMRVHQVRRLNRVPPPPLPVPSMPVPSRPLLEYATMQQEHPQQQHQSGDNTRRFGSSSSISSMASISSASSSSTSSSSASSLFSNRTPLDSSTSVESPPGEDKVVVGPSKSPLPGRESPLTTPDGFSSSIWHRLNKVAEVANQLSVSFGKAMEATMTPHHPNATTTEHIPPVTSGSSSSASSDEEDSSLTKVINDYHTAKASSPPPSDVIDNFEERDRGFNGRLGIANPSPEDEVPSISPLPIPPPPPPSSLRSSPSKELPSIPASAPTSSSRPMSTYRSRLLENVRKGSITGGILNLGKSSDASSSGSSSDEEEGKKTVAIRVRFVDQDHPRRSSTRRHAPATTDKPQQQQPQRSLTFSPPPAVELDLPRGRSRSLQASSSSSTMGERVTIGRPSLPPKKAASLSAVDVRGRRVAVGGGGLPSGVRPQRPSRPV